MPIRTVAVVCLILPLAMAAPAAEDVPTRTPHEVVDDPYVAVPLAERGDVDLMRHGSELVITVGPYRRSIILPDSLSRRHVRRAQLVGGELRITFSLEA